MIATDDFKVTLLLCFYKTLEKKKTVCFYTTLKETVGWLLQNLEKNFWLAFTGPEKN